MYGYAHYIARDNPLAARRLYDRARETFQMLADMPLMGAPYQALRGELSNIRFAPIKGYPNYLVFYRPGNGFIDVLCILHGKMDKDSRMASRLGSS